MSVECGSVKLGVMCVAVCVERHMHFSSSRRTILRHPMRTLPPAARTSRHRHILTSTPPRARAPNSTGSRCPDHSPTSTAARTSRSHTGCPHKAASSCSRRSCPRASAGRGDPPCPILREMEVAPRVAER